MAECDWAILCDYAFLDVNRKMCLIGAFDRVFAERVPVGLPHAAVAMKVLGNPGEQVNFRLEILRPSGGQLFSAQGVAPVGENGTADVQFNILQLGLPDHGIYSVNIHINDEISRAITFQVVRPPAPATQAQG